jgi:carbon monoxide dehydrogenase subunit G
MRISDAQWIPAAQHQVWEALTDCAVLQRCIPGCVQVHCESTTEYDIVVRTRVAGIEADYEGEVLLSDLNPPHGCTLVFEGKGKAAGLAIGTAQVNLTPKEDGTRLSYTVAAMAGGKLAEVGDGMLLKAGEKIIHKFFTSFIDYMVAQPRTAAPEPPPPPEAVGLQNSRWSWAVVTAIVLVFLGYHTYFH